MHVLAAQPGFTEFRAIAAGRVFVADGNLDFNRSEPSVLVSARILAEILHPSAFEPEHEGAAWVGWSGRS